MLILRDPSKELVEPRMKNKGLGAVEGGSSQCLDSDAKLVR